MCSICASIIEFIKKIVINNMSGMIYKFFRPTPIKVRRAVWELNIAMAARQRSRSRESVVIKTDEFVSGSALDPTKLLAEVLSGLNSLDVALTVNITDGDKTVVFALNSFVSKNYEVVDGMVKFGYKRLSVDHLRARLTYEINIDTKLDSIN